MKLVNSNQFFDELMFRNKQKKDDKNIIKYIRFNLSSFKNFKSNESSKNYNIKQNSNITKEFKQSELKSYNYIPDFNFEIIKHNYNINIEEKKIEQIIDNLKNGIIQLNKQNFVLNASKLLKDNINFSNKKYVEKKNFTNIVIHSIKINKNKFKKKNNLCKMNNNSEKLKDKFQNNNNNNIVKSYSIINNSNISDTAKGKNNDSSIFNNTISTKSTKTKILGIVKIKKNFNYKN